MDPNQTWCDLIFACFEGDLDRVDELATALLSWLDKGGFPPTIVARWPVNPVQVDDAAQRFFVRAVCEALLSRFAPTEREP